VEEPKKRRDEPDLGQVALLETLPIKWTLFLLGYTSRPFVEGTEIQKKRAVRP
jgi:hypothetical protein